ncbi:hypothetical protein [Kribbella sp. CA-247076]|uniref:hypothetical protein n=1 Tax=Kribbella sp. CA-247076 TaxID=3239941 RepID=UPI003D8D9B09
MRFRGSELPVFDQLDARPAVETYFRDGAWHTRRGDCPRPFASGSRRERLISVGVDVARWNAVPHIIRDADGAVDEVNVYVTG